MRIEISRRFNVGWSRTSRSVRSVVLAGLLLLHVPAGRASVVDLQVAAATHPDLLHQFTFDGDDDLARRQDKVGNTGDLAEMFNGGATVADLTYGAPGLDATSDAVETFRANPGNC